MKITTDTPIYEFDVESDIEFSKSLGVRNVPVLKFYKEGEVVSTTIGLKSAKEINNLIVETLVWVKN